MKKRNVLLVNYHLQMGGSERLVLELTKESTKTGSNPRSLGSKGKFRLQVSGTRIPLYYVPKRNGSITLRSEIWGNIDK
jgi:hypothetical protein